MVPDKLQLVLADLQRETERKQTFISIQLGEFFGRLTQSVCRYLKNFGSKPFSGFAFTCSCEKKTSPQTKSKKKGIIYTTVNHNTLFIYWTNIYYFMLYKRII
jgi:hypothetical protein